MGERWSLDRVTALAPDASGAASARKLAASGSWSGLGSTTDPPVVWGECRGSGKQPYQAAVDLAGPGFRCSCPSRKIPCKHVLALLLLWSAGEVREVAEPVAWAGSWIAERLARAERAPRVRSSGTSQATVERRAQRAGDGLDELDRWLQDQLRSGIAGLERAGYQPFDALAARMVDAQVPGVASSLRRMPGIAASGEGWPARLLGEFALLHLLAEAHRRIHALDADLAATVRARLGITVSRDEVLAGPAVPDRWHVVGLRDTDEERMIVRRVWLAGERTGRIGVVLSFSVGGAVLDTSLSVATAIEADLHFYPGAAPSRALVGARRGEPEPAALPRGIGLDAALDAWAAALTADPWTTSVPVVLTQVTPVAADRGGWLLSDASGATLPIVAPEDPWVLIAAAGGAPVELLAEVVPAGVHPVSLLQPAADRLEVAAL